MKYKGVFCDTSFFIRLLDSKDPLHHNAKGYFKYFAENDYGLMLSTIAIGEYCVRGSLQDLPLKNLQIIPFNLDHAQRTGEFARIIFGHRGRLDIKDRLVIPNDTKLFAQADCERNVSFFLSSDGESAKVYRLLRTESNPKFQFIDLATPYNETFGVLGI